MLKKGEIALVEVSVGFDEGEVDEFAAEQTEQAERVESIESNGQLPESIETVAEQSPAEQPSDQTDVTLAEKPADQPASDQPATDQSTSERPTESVEPTATIEQKPVSDIISDGVYEFEVAKQRLEQEIAEISMRLLEASELSKSLKKRRDSRTEELAELIAYGPQPIKRKPIKPVTDETEQSNESVTAQQLQRTNGQQ